MSQLVTLDQATVTVSETTTFGPITWQIESGQKWFIAGRNGSGKSVLLELIERGGRVLAGAASGIPQDVVVVSDAAHLALIDRERRQYDGPDDKLEGTSVADLLTELKPVDTVLTELIRRFQLQPLLRQRFRQLSTGETKKVLFVRALASECSMLMLDEPLAGLDAASQAVALGSLADFVGDKTVLLVLNDWAALPDWVDHVAYLSDSRLAYQGPMKPAAARSWLHQMVVLTNDAQALPTPLPSSVPALSAEQALVEMRNICVRFEDRQLFDGLNWRIDPGVHWQVSGANGSGKTTLLSLITGDSPHCYTNDLTVFGFKRGSGESIWQIKQYIGYVSSALHLAYRVSGTVESVIISGFFDSVGVYQRPTAPQKSAASAWLALIGLTQARQQPFAQQSYGNQRLLLIARALVKQPALLILDEPCLGLDAFNRGLVLALIEKLIQGNQTTVLYVSHDHRDQLPSIENTLHLEPS